MVGVDRPMKARFDENPATTQDIKETKHYGQTHGRENSIPSHKQSLPGYKKVATKNIGGIRVNYKLKIDCMN